jgi:AcrR family transcriptional regulator
MSRCQDGEAKLALKQTEAETASRRDRILAAATEVFLRYGHARTTMNDVASEAGISRPALYLVFQRKEDIFAAVIDRLIEDELRRYREAFSRLRSLDKKLHFCCEQWAGHGYDLTKAHPDARDVFNLAFPPVKQMYSTLEAFLADLLRDAVSASKLKTTPEELARVLIFGMRGFKDIAEDGDHMRRLIALQVNLVLRAVTAN